MVVSALLRCSRPAVVSGNVSAAAAAAAGSLRLYDVRWLRRAHNFRPSRPRTAMMVMIVIEWRKMVAV